MLSHGQQVALYLLLSSRSGLRLELEGHSNEIDDPVPQPDANSLYLKLVSLVGNWGNIAANLDQNAIQQYLFDPTGVDPKGRTTNVATNAAKLKNGLGFPLYDPTDPCPAAADQDNVVAALASLPPGS